VAEMWGGRVNIERAKELLPVIKAFSEGKTIQYDVATTRGIEWRDLDGELDFNVNLRVKPSCDYCSNVSVDLSKIPTRSLHVEGVGFTTAGYSFEGKGNLCREHFKELIDGLHKNSFANLGETEPK
jgi:hypothetical protein